MRIASVLMASLLVALAAPFVRAEDLIHIEVVGLHNSKGQVGCSLYPSAEGFPNKPDKAVRNIMVPIKDQKAVCDFKGLAKGTYAVSAMHDEDSSGKMEFNDMGIPSKGVGASKDAKGDMGPPKFKDASFDYPGGRKDLTIHIQYLL